MRNLSTSSCFVGTIYVCSSGATVNGFHTCLLDSSYICFFPLDLFLTDQKHQSNFMIERQRRTFFYLFEYQSRESEGNCRKVGGKVLEARENVLLMEKEAVYICKIRSEERPLTSFLIKW